MTWVAGQIVGGRYELVAPIGSGGMGAVWRARHRMLGREVALKFVRGDVRDPMLVPRFEREAKIAAAIRHRNVVHVEDYGISESGAPYLAMELLEGEPLDDWIAREPHPDLRQIIEVMLGALAGLAAVHAAGFVHRDLKPANILVGRDADGLVPKLVDFGIARTTERNLLSENLATLTHSGVIVGTPAYMSPEQIRGREVDARSDVFSIGAILFEAIAGRRPFDGETVVDLVLALVNTDAAPLASFRPDVPPAVAAIVHRAIARDPAERYPDARAMREALATAPLEPAATTELDALPPAAVRSRRSRWGFVALAMVALVAAAAAVLSAGSPPPSSRPSPRPAMGARPPAARPTTEIPVVVAPPSTECTVELVDLPAEAQVLLDGAPVEGPWLRMPRDGRSRTIEVTLAGRSPWRVEHLSRGDGHYRVVLAAGHHGKAPKRGKSAGPGGWVGEDF